MKILKALYLRYRVPGGRLPTIDELAEDVGLCHSATYRTLLKLKAAGLVTWLTYEARTIRPTSAGILAAQGYRLVWRRP